jgi:hypothetical protein
MLRAGLYLFKHQNRMLTDYLPATENLHTFGTYVYSYPKTITPSIKNGFLNPNFKNKRKVDFIYIVNLFRLSVINMYSRGILPIKPYRKGSRPLDIPIRIRTIPTPNGPKMDSRCLRTVKSNYPWAFIMGKERNPLWCIPTVYLRDRSRKWSFAMITNYISPSLMMMVSRVDLIKTVIRWV